MPRFAVILIGAVMFFGFAGLHSDADAAAAKKAKNAKKKLHHPHLHHALYELHDARRELNNSSYKFGGHKAKALLAINDAIKHIELALVAHGDNIKSVATKRDLQEHHKKYAHHPHLHHAIVELRHAHKEMKEASHDFGGHRKAALRDINIAIHQIELLLKDSRKS